jgi:hypothetical protein
VTAALDYYSQGYDFADALHLACSDTARAVYTFDEKFIRKGKHAVPPVKVVPGKEQTRTVTATPSEQS